jgi:hypothetical protein
MESNDALTEPHFGKDADFESKLTISASPYIVSDTHLDVPYLAQDQVPRFSKCSCGIGVFAFNGLHPSSSRLTSPCQSVTTPNPHQLPWVEEHQPLENSIYTIRKDISGLSKFRLS